LESGRKRSRQGEPARWSARWFHRRAAFRAGRARRCGACDKRLNSKSDRFALE